MIALTLLMYFMGTIHVALAIRVDLIAFFDQHAIEGGVTIFDDQGDRLVWLQIMIELLDVSLPPPPPRLCCTPPASQRALCVHL